MFLGRLFYLMKRPLYHLPLMRPRLFAPMVHEVFARTPYDPDVLREGVREPLVRAAEAQERRA